VSASSWAIILEGKKVKNAAAVARKKSFDKAFIIRIF
jgi:hypothetical protein